MGSEGRLGLLGVASGPDAEKGENHGSSREYFVPINNLNNRGSSDQTTFILARKSSEDP
jgi:hypothetical protein